MKKEATAVAASLLIILFVWGLGYLAGWWHF